jgi:hypothetical protein
MSSPEIARRLRAVLENPSQAEAEGDLYEQVDEFVLTCAASEDPSALLYACDDELQTIHGDDVDHESGEHMRIFLTVLGHLVPVLPTTSVISTWWDLLLRPALRGSKLPHTALAYAKDLTLAALEKPDDPNPEKQNDFRRRILDLYLLDALNDASGEDMMEWAELPAEERERRAAWKANLEDVLVKFGVQRPDVRGCTIRDRQLLIFTIRRCSLHKSTPASQPLPLAYNSSGSYVVLCSILLLSVTRLFWRATFS